jgi:hypothetical protein
VVQPSFTMVRGPMIVVVAARFARLAPATSEHSRRISPEYSE